MPPVQPAVQPQVMQQPVRPVVPPVAPRPVMPPVQPAVVQVEEIRPIQIEQNEILKPIQPVEDIVTPQPIVEEVIEQPIIQQQEFVQPQMQYEDEYEEIEVEEEVEEEVPGDSDGDDVDLLHAKYNANILIAEDNEINQKLIKHTLSSFGMNLMVVENGLLAFEQRKANNYDLIFMDIAMPVMDGVEATKQIKIYEEENNLPHVPIVAVTANALKGDREKFMSQGLDEYCTKPIKKDILAGMLNTFLPDKRVGAKPKIVKVLKKVIKRVPKARPANQQNFVNQPQVQAVQPTVQPIQQNFAQQQFAGQAYQAQPQNLGNVKDILLCKKSIIENKIFGGILSQMTQKLDIVSNASELINAIHNNAYKAIFVDYRSPGFDTISVREAVDDSRIRTGVDTKIILFVDPSKDDINILKNKFDEVVKSGINKSQLETMVQPYIG